MWDLPGSGICPWDSPGKNTGVGCHSSSNSCGEAVRQKGPQLGRQAASSGRRSGSGEVATLGLVPPLGGLVGTIAGTSRKALRLCPVAPLLGFEKQRRAGGMRGAFCVPTWWDCCQRSSSVHVHCLGRRHPRAHLQPTRSSDAIFSSRFIF